MTIYQFEHNISEDGCLIIAEVMGQCDNFEEQQTKCCYEAE